MSSFLVLCEEDTKNRWRDGQVCPDVRQGTMAPWARRLGCVLACYAQIGRGRGEEKKGRKGGEKSGENGRKEKGEDGKSRERTDGRERRRNGEETRGEARRVGERKGLSPGLEWKDDERRWC
ncbi:hypothetical protein TNCV_2102681 [Trichonephila clavipes]|nr:hypothetical protein TNCV_2102681 [Trichonephila clavipes]